MVGVGEDGADLALRLRVGVEDGDIDAVLDQARGPAAADDAAAEDRGPGNVGHFSAPYGAG